MIHGFFGESAEGEAQTWDPQHLDFPDVFSTNGYIVEIPKEYVQIET